MHQNGTIAFLADLGGLADLAKGEGISFDIGNNHETK